MDEYITWEAGTWRDIAYEFCHLIDAILHHLNADRWEWGARFCSWSHRYG